MNKRLETEFLELERTKDSLLHETKGLSETQWQEKPFADSWSVAQVIEHLFQAEKWSLAYLKKKNSSPANELPAAGLDSRLRSAFLYLMLRGPFKFKAPKMVSGPESRELQHVLEDWNDLRTEMKIFLQQYPDEKLNKAIYKHPLVGRLSMRATLSFLKMHIVHHKMQVRRIKNQIS